MLVKGSIYKIKKELIQATLEMSQGFPEAWLNPDYIILWAQPSNAWEEKSFTKIVIPKLIIFVF